MAPGKFYYRYRKKDMHNFTKTRNNLFLAYLRVNYHFVSENFPLRKIGLVVKPFPKLCGETQWQFHNTKYLECKIALVGRDLPVLEHFRKLFFFTRFNKYIVIFFHFSVEKNQWETFVLIESFVIVSIDVKFCVNKIS